MQKIDADPAVLRELETLALAGLKTEADGFSLDLSAAPERWDGLIRRLGREAAYAGLARLLCAEFRRQNSRDFLFSDECVAFELGYHIDAYLWAKGFRGYPRHPTTLIFPRSALDRHCRSVEISEKDLHNPAQRLVFRYRKGLRKPAAPADAESAPSAPPDRAK